MSKSRGNVVDPHAALETYTIDGFRYFLLREGVPHSDGNYSDEKVVKMLNAELGDTLGNLLSRCTAPALNPAQIFPPINAEILMIEECGQQGRDLLDKVSNLAVEVAEHYDECNFYRGLDAIMSCLRDTNAFIQSQAPWTLKKRPEKQRHLQTVLHIALESLRVSGLLLQPVMPSLSDSLLTRLGVTPSERTAKYLNCHWGDKGCNSPYENRPLGGDKSVLFQKIVTK
ncbi:PREDICTED: methionine--tRNA ligase, mitochondrial-like [Priapulus caudatus]|uniref:Methionine--tRNA ligase, mitochondrial n=1 Tax=Priapulus caudatus TaxID=37621 RepID=A0ABM1EGR7_PRICU|nr:PREDICTED: methionine--tRNA ligase, mitochondrial-like [Priapulus caudatus]